MPPVSSFMPVDTSGVQPQQNILKLEELEALRLKDYEGLEQEECASRMEVSRPTFQRILLSARAKVADSLINGKAIHIEGGNFALHVCPFKCLDCGYEWQENYENMTDAVRNGKSVCPQCQSARIVCGRGGGRGRFCRGHCRGRRNGESISEE